MVKIVGLVVALNVASLLGWHLSAEELRQTAPAAAEKAATSVAPETGDALVFSATNRLVLDEILSRPNKELAASSIAPRVARLASLILEQSHFRQQSLDDTIASKTLDRYVEILDTMHLLFLESDMQEFARYRTTIDDLLVRKGDVTPAYAVFARFLERLEQRVAYVAELLTTEKFEFTGEDRYHLDRRKAPRPKNLDEAKQLWRQHLRYEILQEKLAKEKPEQIADKITRRYARLLRTFKGYDGDDVFELYLSSLAHAYDPHSDYMGKSAFESFNIGMKLSLFGIGALLQSEDGYCQIKSLVPNGPAARSGKIKENDKIIAVAQGDQEPVDVIDEKLSKVVDMIRGPKGTEVRLTIIPADAADPSERKIVSLLRDEIKLEDQEAKAKIIEVPGDQDQTLRLGLIDLPSFYADFDRKSASGERKSTTRDVEILVRKLVEEKIDGLILDLRRNGGGSLEEAINLTGLFIKEGPIVQVKDPDNSRTVDSDPDPSILYNGPMIVLTSRFSASASEILAGALQDYGRALIVGDSSTHGKGTVQQLVPLDRYSKSFGDQNPGALKVTIRKFYRASGSSTQLRGVVPDIILPSLNNHAEVGESALGIENALPWDTIASAKFEKLNWIEPILKELQARSAKRIEKDKDFEYLREDIEQLRKALADKSVSLNEAKRVAEKQEAEARMKARAAELKARPAADEKVYEISLKAALEPGLPAPLTQTNHVGSVEGNHPITADPLQAGVEPENEDPASKTPVVDAALKETKRILVDLIELASTRSGVATAAVDGESDSAQGFSGVARDKDRLKSSGQ